VSRGGSGRRDHEEFDEFAVGWALRALEPDDESRFGKHLLDCSRCTQTVREAQDMTAAMAMAVPLEEPSEALRTRILAAVAAEPCDSELRDADLRDANLRDANLRDANLRDSGLRDPGFRDTERRGRERHESTVRRPDQSSSRPPPAAGASLRPARHLHRPRGRVRVIARGLALAAAFAFVVGLGVWIVDLRDDRSVAQAVAARQADVLDQFNDRGIYHVAPLQTSDGAAVGVVVVHDGAAKIMADGLPVNDAEREILVLWGMRSQLSPVALGTFDVVRSELDVRTVSSTSTGLDQYNGYAISREPGRQAPASPTELIATGTVGS